MEIIILQIQILNARKELSRIVEEKACGPPFKTQPYTISELYKRSDNYDGVVTSRTRHAGV